MTGSEVTSQPVKLDVTGAAPRQSQIDAIQAVLSKEPRLDGGLSWDSTNRKVVVRLVEPSAERSTAAERLQSSIMTATGGFDVEFQSVEYSRGELEELSHRLFTTQSTWAPGLRGAGGGWDPASNRVEVLVRDDTGHAPAWAAKVGALHDPRIVLRTFTPAPGPWYENRLDDSAPWTGGAWMSHDPNSAATATNGICTMGFTWRKWTTNVRYAGTAYHCTAASTGNWYNNHEFLGRVSFTSPASDAMLLGGSTYSPTVFLGSVSTSDIRQVKAVDSSWQPGDPVAFSGSHTGLVVANVVKSGYYEPCMEKFVTLMDRHVTTGGDSGGPWLTTMSGSGDVVAHGQHLGYGCAPGGRGSVFMPAATISSYLDASIAISS